MSHSVSEHRSSAPRAIPCAVVTVSDTRTPATDQGGDLVVKLLAESGHTVVRRELVPDEPDRIAQVVRELAQSSTVQAVLITGGTGISPRDHTFATVQRLLDSEISGYGELFRMLSYHEIGAAAMLSRSAAGLIGRVVIATMPGSPAGIQLAMQKLLVPELGHLVREANRGT